MVLEQLGIESKLVLESEFVKLNVSDSFMLRMGVSNNKFQKD